jgi:hypothetical protein
VLGIAAARQELPSEIALLLRLTGAAATAIGIGMLLTIVFGIAVGVGVGDAGIVVLLVLTLLGWLVQRRPRAGTLFAGLAGSYLVALGVAWWAMTARPGA